MIIKKLKSSVFFVLLFCVGINPTWAQYFVPAQALEFPYNGPNVTAAEDVSCYSFRNETPTAWGDVDVYLAGWGNVDGEVTVQFTAPGDPSDIKHQEIIPYQTRYNIAVGATFNANTNTMQVLVAYQYQGFKLDIYNITTSSTNPLVLDSTINLTNDPLTTFDRRRIRMDTHKNKAAIIWDYPNHGIQAIGCENGNWGNIIDISNTYGFESPDVALTETAGVPYLRMVYLKPPAAPYIGEVWCQSIDFNTLMTASNFATPSTGYGFGFGAVTSYWGYANPVIDCKDYEDFENWAITCNVPGTNYIYVCCRYDDGVSTPTYPVMPVNSGLLGNMNIYGMYNVSSPSLHYGGGPYGPDQIMVGWYATNGSFHGFMGLSMKLDASGLVSDPDYLEFPNSTSPNQSISGIAFSKEDKELAPNFLYATYFNRQGTTSTPYELHHAFHKWDNTAFKKEMDVKVSTGTTYPNPFSNEIHTTITATENGFVSLQLVDITGRMVSQKKFSAQKGKNAFTIEGLQNVLPGTYFLNTTVNGKNVNTQVVVKH